MKAHITITMYNTPLGVQKIVGLEEVADVIDDVLYKWVHVRGMMGLPPESKEGPAILIQVVTNDFKIPDPTDTDEIDHEIIGIVKGMFDLGDITEDEYLMVIKAITESK